MKISVLQSLMSATRTAIAETHEHLEFYFDAKAVHAACNDLPMEYLCHNKIKTLKESIKKLVAQQKELKACYYEELALQKCMSDDELYFSEISYKE